MKIIFSPAKSMNFSNSFNKQINTINVEKTNNLFSILSKFSEEKLGKIMKIKGKTLEKTFNFYQNNNKVKKSIYAYSGVSFKELHLNSYDENQLNYLNSNLVILSAMYGIIKPFDYIKEYRLDMTMKILEDVSLYNYWREDIEEYFKNEKIIINLASKEFSKMIKFPMINIDFKENKNGVFKSVSSYSKKARGLMLDYLIRNNISEVSQIKRFNLDNYQLNLKLSDSENLIFTR